LAKVTKTVSADRLLCRRGPLPHKAEKTAGCNIFAGRPCRFITLYAKICYALSHFTWPAVFPAFFRSLSADGYNPVYAHPSLILKFIKIFFTAQIDCAVGILFCSRNQKSPLVLGEI
jgi:hypothetical protein